MRAITDYRFTRRPGGGVEPPTREHGVALAGPALFAIKHAWVSRGIKHHFVTVVVGVHRVKDVARVDADPLHIAGRTFERQKTDAWLICPIPVVGQTGTALCGIQIKDTRQVKNQRVFFGDGHVVNHRATWQRNVNVATHAPVDTNYEILHLVAPAPVIRHHVHLAGGGVALGVSRKRER